MKLLYIIFFVVSIYSCNNVDNRSIGLTHKQIAFKDTSVVSKECIQKDTITELGTNIRYINNNGKFQIRWGNSNYTRTYDSLFTCDYDTMSGLWDFVPKYNAETLKTLVLTYVLATSGGGNPEPVELSALVLPKNIYDSAYVKDFFVNCIGNYLIYGDEENDENIHILNVESKKKQDIILNPKPANFKSPTISIRETKIDKKNFSIRYEIFKIVADTAVVVAKTFKLRI